MRDVLRIGCGAGFWGDSPEGPAQLVRGGGVDYLVLDYLAEITMSILARMKAKRPEAGYAADFVTLAMKPLAREIAKKRIKVVTNAGGVNPKACRAALASVLEEAGVALKIAIVEGDDLSGRAAELHRKAIKEMFSGAPLPAELASVNAYLGAFPIAAALAAGVDIVITGRCVDSAIVLGPLIHEFGWTRDDYDLLAAGSLAGHIIECGAQATGGVFTDWRDVDGWDRMGFPIAECRRDGSFEISKPSGTGGLVTPATIAEQIGYEVGDPARYLLPDVTCDFSQVRLAQVGPDRVRVIGAKGDAPTASYKVSATYADGYRAAAMLMIAGRDAVAKGEAVGAAILARSSRLMREAGVADFSETSVEVLGGEASYGRHARAQDAREVIVKIAARHPSKEGLQIFAREIYPAATAMAQGLTGFAGGRPEPQPVVRLFSFLVDKADVPVSVSIGEATIDAPTYLAAERPRAAQRAQAAATPASEGASAKLPLLALAHGRSGDKGDIANIAIFARKPDFVAILRRHLTAESVGDYFAHFVRGKVERFEWPGLDGFNFLLHEALGGGGIASLRHDPQGKAMAQVLLDMPIEVPALWLEAGNLLAGWGACGLESPR